MEDITDDIKKRNLLITAVSVQPFKTLLSLWKPKKLIECTYQEVVQKLRTNYARVTFSSTERVKLLRLVKNRHSLKGFANNKKYENSIEEIR